MLDNLNVFESVIWMSQLAACVYRSVIIQFVQSVSEMSAAMLVADDSLIRR